jgi:hypothetical protein
MYRPPPQRTLMAMSTLTRREHQMNATPLKVVRSTGLVLVALTTLSASAAAMGPNTTELAAVPASACPCMVAGGPPGGRSALLRAANHAARAGLTVPVAQVAVASSPVTQPGTTFDWPDAGVGAGFTLAIGLLGVGGASVLRRREARTHVGA